MMRVSEDRTESARRFISTCKKYIHKDVTTVCTVFEAFISFSIMILWGPGRFPTGMHTWSEMILFHHTSAAFSLTSGGIVFDHIMGNQTPYQLQLVYSLSALILYGTVLVTQLFNTPFYDLNVSRRLRVMILLHVLAVGIYLITVITILTTRLKREPSDKVTSSIDKKRSTKTNKKSFAKMCLLFPDEEEEEIFDIQQLKEVVLGPMGGTREITSPTNLRQSTILDDRHDFDQYQITQDITGGISAPNHDNAEEHRASVSGTVTKGVEKVMFQNIEAASRNNVEDAPIASGKEGTTSIIGEEHAPANSGNEHSSESGREDASLESGKQHTTSENGKEHPTEIDEEHPSTSGKDYIFESGNEHALTESGSEDPPFESAKQDTTIESSKEHTSESGNDHALTGSGKEDPPFESGKENTLPGSSKEQTSEIANGHAPTESSREDPPFKSGTENTSSESGKELLPTTSGIEQTSSENGKEQTAKTTNENAPTEGDKRTTSGSEKGESFGNEEKEIQN